MSILLYDRQTLGATIGIEKTMLETLKAADKLCLYSVQLCLGSPMVFKRKNFTENDIKESNDYLKKNRINLYSHLPYLYNLAGSKKNNLLNWSGNKDQDEKAESVLKGIEHELSVVSKCAKDTKCKSGCVLHIGSWANKEKGLNAVVKSIDKINFPENSTLLLETMVGRGDVLGTSFKDLKYVYDNTINKDHVKICVDTCHVFANGDYDLRRMEMVEKMFKDFNEVFGSIDMMGLVHLNDSNEPYNSKKDNHQDIGQGYIWGENNKSVLIRLLDKLEEYGISSTLETPSISDYPLIQSL